MEEEGKKCDECGMPIEGDECDCDGNKCKHCCKCDADEKKE